MAGGKERRHAGDMCKRPYRIGTVGYERAIAAMNATWRLTGNAAVGPRRNIPDHRHPLLKQSEVHARHDAQQSQTITHSRPWNEKGTIVNDVYSKESRRRKFFRGDKNIRIRFASSIM